VTGSCGFIGSNLVERLCSDGIKVVGVDDLCRNGSEYNLQSLSRFSNFVHHKVNVSDRNVLSDIFQKDGPFDAIYHLAAQVAVTTSYVDPGADFRVNAQGSFNVIECAHRFSPKAYCLYASTNKVYGHLIVDEPVGMQHNLDPYTPYGVSKAVGELYFREFGRDEFGLETCCLRQSCIYGDRQFGVEDQGWVAWFMAANLLGMPVTVYGDGQQVRDLLYITDLIDLYQLAWRKRLVGSYPVGGGATNAISVKAALNLIETVTGQKFASKGHGPARAGDQPYFVADNSWASDLKLGWQPQISVEVGMRRLNNSLRSRTDQLKKIFAK
jgi:CDP-paratose 2-epimerase